MIHLFCIITQVPSFNLMKKQMQHPFNFTMGRYGTFQIILRIKYFSTYNDIWLV